MLHQRADTFDKAPAAGPLVQSNPARPKLLHLIVLAAFTAALVAANLFVLGASRRLVLSTTLVAFAATFAGAIMATDHEPAR